MRSIMSLMVMIIACLTIVTRANAEETPVRATIDSDGVQRVVVLGGGYFLRPKHIIVKVNVPVELKVSKEPGWVPHNIAMDSPEAGMAFEVSLSEEPKLVRFSATKTGTFPIYCSKKLLFFSSHREKGMEGRVEVIE
ncbi:quinol oxidase [Geobacter sp. OR-1]|uniref:quinol oxidase n=1 Tax=Geobacter sp. OR-1 TaxID=1266765 RepID=UPI0005A706E2|nr:quinol oxidase [Geobacter sp. OR-1]